MHAKTNSYASLLSKSQSQVPLKVTQITLLGFPSRPTALQMAPLSPYLTNISEARGILEQQTRGMWPLKKAKQLLVRPASCPTGLASPWRRERGADAASVCFKWSVGKKKQADVRYQLCPAITAQLFNHGELRNRI